MKLAIVGIRDVPGGKTVTAGSDTFAYELGQKLCQKGWEVTAFAQGPPKKTKINSIEYQYFPTIQGVGFNTFVHTFKSCFHIVKGKFDIVHIHNSGNSFIIPLLRLLGIKSVVMVDGKDWVRAKWKWYAKVYLYLTRILAYRVANVIIFDNVFAREEAKQDHRYIDKKSFFIPYGADYMFKENRIKLLKKYGLEKGEYYLFVGRFIPEKGIQYLVRANNELNLNKKIVIVGGNIGHFDYQDYLYSINKKSNVVFTGPLYNEEMRSVMKNAFAYIQPSEVEGLSPVLLTASSASLPIIASDIKENKYIGEDNMVYFESKNYKDLKDKIQQFEDVSPEEIKAMATRCAQSVLSRFRWEEVTRQHDEIFRELIGAN